MRIKNKLIGEGCDVFIIAEVGINHGGNPDICRQMIQAASNAGADAVKLQIVNADEAYVNGTASYEEFSKAKLEYDSLVHLMDFAKQNNIILFSTPGDLGSLEIMKKLEMPAIKISSGLLSNIPLIELAADTGLPIILSSGMALKSEIEEALDAVARQGASEVALLHCTSIYPLQDCDVNLAMMRAKHKTFNIIVGFSDHTVDELACLASVAAGARIIEKHFTLNSSLSGADHHISMEPRPFAEMVKKIRRISSMLGSEIIGPTEEETALRRERLRCIVARKPIQRGEVFSHNNLALKRPMSDQRGIEPRDFKSVLGKIAANALCVDDPVTWLDVKQANE